MSRTPSKSSGQPPAPTHAVPDEAAPSAESELLDLVGVASPRARIDHVVIGRLEAVDDDGTVRVSHPHMPSPRDEALPARVVGSISEAEPGAEVALLFVDGDPGQPIVFGLMDAGGRRPEVAVRADRERVLIEADREIELRCGKSSIVMTRDGKIRIRGADVLSRSSGGNRIKGGSVRIN